MQHAEKWPRGSGQWNIQYALVQSLIPYRCWFLESLTDLPIDTVKRPFCVDIETYGMSLVLCTLLFVKGI